MADETTGPDFESAIFPAGVTVPEQAAHRVRDERRGDVVLRHARLTGRGRPTFCSPSRAEQSGVVHLRSGSGTDGKVIYPTREAAEAAARELEGLGARRLRPYLCARSRHGHYHLTTDRTPRPVLPQQPAAAVPAPRPSADRAIGAVPAPRLSTDAVTGTAPVPRPSTDEAIGAAPAPRRGIDRATGGIPAPRLSADAATGAAPAPRLSADAATGAAPVPRIPRQAGGPGAASPLHLPQQRRPA